jgi:hypothetical protein
VKPTVIVVALLGLLTACGSSSGTSGAATSAAATVTPSVAASAPPTATPAPAPAQADLQAVAQKLYPPASDPSMGRLTCFQGDTSFATCPLTPRLRASLAAAATGQTGGGADLICGCQNLDPGISITFTPGSPAGDGTIAATQFGHTVDYVVISSGGQFLVDDITYCHAAGDSTPTTSVFPDEAVSC